MKISKHVHSCLLVEDSGMVALIDPGSYTAKEHALDLSGLSRLDYILITHEHQDHLHVPLVREARERFPAVRVITNGSVAKKLKEENIEAETWGTEAVEMHAASHENILGNEPENSLFHVFGQLTHPGDSLHFAETKRVLALPIQAPWGSMVAALEKAAQLKPKIVIPIHDWHWNEEARQNLYAMAESHLSSHGIQFRGISSNEQIEV